MVDMVDLIILGVFFISILIGWFRGAIKEIFSITSWVGSGYLAYKLFPVGLDITRSFITQPLLANLVTGGALFIIFLIILSLLTYSFSSIVRESIFNTADKFCGALFGVVRGIFILAITDFCTTYYIFKEQPEALKKSQLAPYVKNVSQMLFLLLPDSMKTELVNHLGNEKQKELISAFGGKINNSIFANNIQSNKPVEKPSDNNSAKEIAQLGVKKSEPNQNLNKSVRSDLDKFIDQYT